MKQFAKQGSKNVTGAIGEKLTCNWLENKGFSILDTNYLKKWGEIDVIAQKLEVIHFIEVKTVSYETKTLLDQAVSHGTWRPEEQVHEFKIKKFGRIIDTWLLEHKYQGEWQIDVSAVRTVPNEKYATINYFKNIIA